MIKVLLEIVRQVSYILRSGSLGLRDVRQKVIECLESGQIQHDTDRDGNINEKNLLLTGQIKVEQVILLLKKTKGTEFRTVPHETIRTINVHIFKPKGWYIKCYFIDPDVFFISVHK